MKRREFMAAAGSAGISGLAATRALADQPAGATPVASLPATGRSGPSTLPANWTLANLRGDTGPRLAVKTEHGLLDVTVAAKALGRKIPQTTDEVIANGDVGLRECVAAALKAPRKEWMVAEDDAQFAPCVSNPQKIVCIGLNYRRHAREVGLAEPKVPILFNKFNNSLNHHRATVPTGGLPGSHFDYETELVIVMGRRCSMVTEAQALDYVYGYCTGNDFSERTYQMITSQWVAGKTSDGFAPIGPYLVSADLVGDPNALVLETHVNGELRQSSNTSDFIFNCNQVISYCSHLFPLEPGDIIFTGTPEGVILGMPKEKQVWLKPGDKIVSTIQKTGTLEVTVA